MYKILDARELAANIYLMEVEARRIAKRCQPGQFIIVRTDEEGERIPLTIVIMTGKRERLPLYSRQWEPEHRKWHI